MPVLSYIAIYFVLWWLCFFAILPFGVRTQSESGDITRGTDPGAPSVPRLLVKVLITSVVTAVVMALVLWGLSHPIIQEYWR